MTYWPVHAHSAYSALDGMDSPKDMVARVVELGQPALALTDHGTMGGVVQGYKESKKAGIKFFPGSELYVVRDATDARTKGDRWHMGMMALDLVGYQAMVKLLSRSYQPDRFYRKPLVDLQDFASLAESDLTEHLAVTTGCFSGMVINEWKGEDPVQRAVDMIMLLARWFPNLYVELQNHKITWEGGVTELDISSDLFDIAQELSLPVVFGADSHYVHREKQPAHDLMKDICYFGDGEDNHFKGGPYHLHSWKEVKKLVPKDWCDAILEGHQDLLDRNKLSIPALDNYKFRVPTMVKKNPTARLAELAQKGIKDKGKELVRVYQDRLAYELDVIEKLGMANYFLLVREHVTNWCRTNDVIVNVRGSANGSLVCYLIGVTNVDPIKWGTSFDRFLSLDRQKPPDIDFDVDFRGRQRLIEHLRNVFPTITQVGTYSKLGYGDDDESGSVVTQYMAAMRRKNPRFDGRIDPAHRDALDMLANTLAYKSMGTNAAGLILPGEGFPVADYLPLSRIVSSDTVVTQFSKDDVEAFGYVKVDILGLRVLQTLNETLVKIGKAPNEWDWIPLNDPKSCALLRSGRGTGLFQFEGMATQMGGKELKVRSTKDAILTMACYRPALMNGGQKDLYLANRGQRKDQQTRLHSLLDPILDDTAGVPLFQEQILETLKAIGMKFVEYNELMGAIKASNGNIRNAAATFDRLMPLFYDLCEDRGINETEADSIWHAVVGFTDYGFNRAHATSYGLMAYYSAYLKVNYPLEYMASLLDVWGDNKDKTTAYSAEARRLGVRIVRAHVNHSEARWSVDPTRQNALRKGLVSIPGVGEPTGAVIAAERAAHGPYTSIQDFVDRTPRRPVTGGREWRTKGTLVGVCKLLQDAGALDGLQ